AHFGLAGRGAGCRRGASFGGRGVCRGPARRALSDRALGRGSDRHQAPCGHQARHRRQRALPRAAGRATVERMTMTAGAKFRDVLAKKRLVEAMAAHSPLSAMLVAEAGFDAIWASGFELS